MTNTVTVKTNKKLKAMAEAVDNHFEHSKIFDAVHKLDGLVERITTYFNDSNVGHRDTSTTTIAMMFDITTDDIIDEPNTMGYRLEVDGMDVLVTATPSGSYRSRPQPLVVRNGAWYFDIGGFGFQWRFFITVPEFSIEYPVTDIVAYVRALATIAMNTETILALCELDETNTITLSREAFIDLYTLAETPLDELWLPPYSVEYKGQVWKN